LKREKEESLTIFNRRFCRTYYDIPLEIRPTEIVAMVYYLMAQHNEFVLLLLERKSSSLRNLFEDTQEVEENIWASNKIREQAYFEDLHALDEHQEDYEYTPELQQRDSEYEVDLRQQQEWKHSSDFEQGSNECSFGTTDKQVPAYFRFRIRIRQYSHNASKNRYACLKSYKQFVNPSGSYDN
jgi:hypothetical protein